MTIQTDNNGINYLGITTPVVVSIFNAALASRMYITSVYDNLSTQVTFSCTITDNNCSPLYNTQITMSGTDYTGWNGDNITPYIYCGTQIQNQFSSITFS